MKFKFLNSAWQELKNSALKFPAFFSGTIVAAVSATLAVCSNDIFRGQYEALRKSGASYDSEPYSALRERENAFSENASFLALSAVWCCAASFFAEMLCRVLCAKKDIQGKKKALIHAAGQVLSALLSVPIFFLLKSESDWRPFVYGSSLFIFVAMGLWMLHKFQDEEKVVPNAVVSLVMQGITVTCLVLGLLLVVFAFKNLIYSFSNNIPFAACFFFSSFVIGMNLLVSCVTRPRERVSIPKAFNVIVSCALLPIYAMLLLVLYVYFAKCIFTRSMPVGMVNPFVSAATAVYLFFYLALPREGTFSAAGKFLRRWGAIFLLPLIALQCFSFGIRIREYGFTLSRVASLYYIIASIIFCILPFVKKGKYMKSVYLVLSLAAFLMAVPGTGCISIARFSQTSRIVGIYKTHSLYENGRLDAAKAEALLSDKEKAAVVSAADELNDFKKMPSWWVESSKEENKYADSFEKTFGFAHSTKYARRAKGEAMELYNSLTLYLPAGAALDVGEFSTLYSFYESGRGSSDGGVISFGPESEEKELDFTNELKEFLLKNSSKSEERYSYGKEVEHVLTLKKDGWTVIFTRLELSLKDGDSSFYEFSASGYVCK
jgi:hypothetical protein